MGKLSKKDTYYGCASYDFEYEDKSYRIQNIYSSEEDQEYFKFTVKKVEAIRYKDLPQHLRTRELEQYYKRVSIEKNYKEFSNKDRVYLINLSWE